MGYLRECKDKLNTSNTNVKENDDATQDILHCIELCDNSYHSYAQLAKKLKEVREDRRNAKDISAALTPLVSWYDANFKVIKDLEQVLGAMRTEERKQSNRIYMPKTKELESMGITTKRRKS